MILVLATFLQINPQIEWLLRHKPRPNSILIIIIIITVDSIIIGATSVVVIVKVFSIATSPLADEGC